MSSRALQRAGLTPFALAALVLTGCGSDTANDLPATTSTIVGTTTLAAAPADTGEAPEQAGAPADPTGTVDPAASDDTRLMAPLVIDYVLGGELAPLDGPAAAWQWPAGAVVTAEQVTALATALGVGGDVAQQSADMGGGWSVGTSDVQRLSVGADAQGTWWYSGPTAVICVDPGLPPPTPDAATTKAGKAAPVEAAPDPSLAPDGVPGSDVNAGTAIEPAVEPAPPASEPCVPPAGIPTAEQAQTRATGVMVAIGLDPANYEMRADSQEWGAWVDAQLVLDGIASPVTTSFGFGADGVMTYASGQLLAPERTAELTRVGTDVGFARLQAETLAAAGDLDGAVASPAVDPASTVEPAPDTTVPTTVTIVAAEPDWWMAWPADGSVWLYPAYAFVSDQGERMIAVAVPDAALPPELRGDLPVPQTDVEPAVDPAAEPPSQG